MFMQNLPIKILFNLWILCYNTGHDIKLPDYLHNDYSLVYCAAALLCTEEKTQIVEEEKIKRRNEYYGF